MKCHQVFCVYQCQGICTSDEAYINIDGDCANYSPVYIPEEDLEEYKSKHMKKYTDYLKGKRDEVDMLIDEMTENLMSKISVIENEDVKRNLK